MPGGTIPPLASALRLANRPAISEPSEESHVLRVNFIKVILSSGPRYAGYQATDCSARFSATSLSAESIIESANSFSY